MALAASDSSRLAVLETQVINLKEGMDEIREVCKTRPGECFKGILDDRVKVWNELKDNRARLDGLVVTVAEMKRNDFTHFDARITKLEGKKPTSTRVRVALIDFFKYVVIALIGVAAGRYLPPVG